MRSKRRFAEWGRRLVIRRESDLLSKQASPPKRIFRVRISLAYIGLRMNQFDAPVLLILRLVASTAQQRIHAGTRKRPRTDTY